MTGTGDQLNNLSPVEQTLLLTLGGRAADARLSSPFLGDVMAAQIFDNIAEGDRDKIGDADLARNVAIRTSVLDRHVQDFLGKVPECCHHRTGTRLRNSSV